LGTLACALFVAVLGGLAPSLLRLAFGPVVADQGASSLRILVVGQGAFTLFGLAASVLTSLGQEKRAAVASLGASLLVALACWLTVPHAAFGVPQLQACATATTVSLLLALGVGWRLAQRAAGGFVPWRSAGRAMIAAAAVASVGQRLPSLGLVATGLAAAGLGALYIILLVALGELGAEDRHALKTVLRRRSSSSA
jgi:stage V sporulation protein B